MKFVIEEVEKKINFTFSQKKLLITAFTHPSYRNEQMEIDEDSERLEFLGDAVLNLVVTEHLFLLFPTFSEGALSSARSSLVNTRSCCHYTNALRLGEHLLMGKGERMQNLRGKTSAYANLFEALLGALYLDGGLSPARQLILPLLPDRDKILPLMAENPKNHLQHIVQKELHILPTYVCSPCTLPQGSSGYHAQVIVNHEVWGEGYAPSKKEAEIIAAKKALDTYEHKNQNPMGM